MAPRHRRRAPGEVPSVPAPRPGEEEAARAAEGADGLAVTMEGLRVVDETGGPLGQFLYLAHRAVELWATAAPRERRGIFTVRAHRERAAELRGLELDDSLRAPLSVLVEMVGAPEQADPYAVADACKAVAGWAAARERFETARLFAELAVRSVPGDPRPLYVAGRYARQGANYAAADRLLSLAVDVARRKGDWKTFCRALSCSGIMHQRRGNYRRARSLHLLCYRTAEKRKLREMAGEAAHDLFTVEAECGHVEAAEGWARTALAAYARNHPRRHALAYDTAFFWLEQGRFSKALAALRTVLPEISSPSERVLVLSSIARAAAGCGARLGFEEHAVEVTTMVDESSSEREASALLDLVHGAISLEKWDFAERTVTRVVEVARRRREGRVRLEAEAMLDAVRRNRVAHRRVKRESETDKLWRLMMDMLDDDPGAAGS